MNKFISKFFFYYPVTLLNGEFIAFYKPFYEKFQYASSVEQFAYKQQKLKNIVDFSKKYSAFYSQSFTKNSDIKSISDFEALPFLSKQDLIKNINLINTSKRRFAKVKTTGGSTGEPVKLFKTADALARERAATWRAYSWAGIGIGDKQGRFWGVPHSRKNSFKAKLIDTIANRFRISAFNLSESSLELYYGKLKTYQPGYLYGYVSAIHTLTKYCMDKGYAPIESIKAIITTSEVLSDKARKDIKTFWGVNVFNEYGCGEVGSIAHECEFGRLHVMSDNLHVEIIDKDGKSANTGEIVVTDYYNRATPLIRYKLGDFASWSDEICPCGRTLPVLHGIHGRAYDLIKTSSGREIHPESVIYIFEELQTKYAAFKKFQIVQVELDRLEIRIIKSGAWTDEIEGLISTAIKRVIDESMRISFIYCSELTREKSGKMRVVKSML